MAVSGSAPSGPARVGSPRVGPARRGPGCLAWAGAIVVSVLVLCCAGAATGAGAGWFTSRPGEAAIPPAPPGFPSGTYLPQVDIDEVVAGLVDQGYQCGPSDSYLYTLDCSAPELTGVRNGRLVTDHDDAGTRAVTVVCVPRDDEAANCQQLFTQATGTVLVGHPPEVREQAQDWVGEHAEITASTTVGEVELTVRQFRSSVELRIWPA